MSELREGEAGTQRKGARDSSAAPCLPRAWASRNLTFSPKSLIPTVRVGFAGSGALGCA